MALGQEIRRPPADQLSEGAGDLKNESFELRSVSCLLRQLPDLVRFSLRAVRSRQTTFMESIWVLLFRILLVGSIGNPLFPS